MAREAALQTSATPRDIARLSPEEVFSSLDSNHHGITTTEAAARRALVGLNELPPPSRPSIWKRFFRQFRDLFAIMLLVAAAIAFITYFPDNRNPYDLELGIAILGVVLLNAVIGFAQEYQAERATEALQRLVPRAARVLRDGEEVHIQTTELVPGDVALLEEGDEVPADLRLVRAYELSTNNASLTGESAPVRKTIDPVFEQNLAETELPNLVFMGTAVASGSGMGIVYATGLRTQFGRVFRLTAQLTGRPSPLQLEVAAMALLVARAALVIGVIMFILGYFLRLGLIEDFLFALGVMMAMVPQGMPATMTVSLAVGVQQMARRAALIKRLSAVETLGSTGVICTDKTGTLTRGQMTVVELTVNSQRLHFTGTGYQPQGQLEDSNGNPIGNLSPLILEALRCAALCTTARLVPPKQPGDEWQVLGDPTEGALLTAASKVGLTPELLSQRYPRKALLPFDSGRKRMTTINDLDGCYIAYTKGAPREVIENCTRVLENGEERSWTEAERQAALAENDEMAARALRVLALARRQLPPELADRKAEHVERDLCFLGLIALTDPPRPEVAEAVRDAKHAGIRIVMVTGDYGLTADAIAHSIGICEQPLPRIITGFELDQMDDEQLGRELEEHQEVIFARVAPEHKLRVVAAFQSLGKVVAVTGDGVNDAPALKRADIGVAMGLTGTDVSREAATMVLIDDSFASIVHAVRLGRAAYDNIRRFVTYIFAHNMGELMPYLFATVAGVHLLPLNVLQILSIDLGSDVLPGLALGTEAPEPDVMRHPPRPRGTRLLNRATIGRILFLGSIQSLGSVGAFLSVLLLGGWTWGAALPTSDALYRHAITATQAAIVVSQFFNGFVVRTTLESVFSAGLFRNWRLVMAETIAVAILAMISYVPLLQEIFNTAPLTLRDWTIVAVFGALLFTAEEIRKAIVRARRRNDLYMGR
ncbi:MAG: cation-transporting P-type ATPase [Chloroflexi bacterium]|nr:cation-transporting P-type ATPase [Chloroflexota bacterium]